MKKLLAFALFTLIGYTVPVQALTYENGIPSLSIYEVTYEQKSDGIGYYAIYTRSNTIQTPHIDIIQGETTLTYEDFTCEEILDSYGVAYTKKCGIDILTPGTLALSAVDFAGNKTEKVVEISEVGELEELTSSAITVDEELFVTTRLYDNQGQDQEENTPTYAEGFYYTYDSAKEHVFSHHKFSSTNRIIPYLDDGSIQTVGQVQLSEIRNASDVVSDQFELVSITGENCDEEGNYEISEELLTECIFTWKHKDYIEEIAADSTDRPGNKDWMIVSNEGSRDVRVDGPLKLTTHPSTGDSYMMQHMDAEISGIAYDIEVSKFVDGQWQQLGDRISEDLGRDIFFHPVSEELYVITSDGIFVFRDDAWVGIAKDLLSEDEFIAYTSINSAGNVLVAIHGYTDFENGHNRVALYNSQEDTVQFLGGTQEFGGDSLYAWHEVALAENGDAYIAVKNVDSSVNVYKYTGTSWQPLGEVFTPSNEKFNYIEDFELYITQNNQLHLQIASSARKIFDGQISTSFKEFDEEDHETYTWNGGSWELGTYNADVSYSINYLDQGSTKGMAYRVYSDYATFMTLEELDDGVWETVGQQNFFPEIGNLGDVYKDGDHYHIVSTYYDRKSLNSHIMVHKSGEASDLEIIEDDQIDAEAEIQEKVAGIDGATYATAEKVGGGYAMSASIDGQETYSEITIGEVVDVSVDIANISGAEDVILYLFLAKVTDPTNPGDEGDFVTDTYYTDQVIPIGKSKSYNFKWRNDEESGVYRVFAEIKSADWTKNLQKENVMMIDVVESTSPQNIGGTLHRFWSDLYNGHFYTALEVEAQDLRDNNPNWRYEGIGGKTINAQSLTLDEAGSLTLTPVYRFWSETYNHHFYTISKAEKEDLEANNPNWAYEGIAYHTYASRQMDTTEVYRFWSETYQAHFYTSSLAEKESIEESDKSWKYEGVAWYIQR